MIFISPPNCQAPRLLICLVASLQRPLDKVAFEESRKEFDRCFYLFCLILKPAMGIPPRAFDGLAAK